MKKLIIMFVVLAIVVLGAVFAQGEVMAGLSNIAFGLYSWRSGDILGGVLLTSASVIGLGMIITSEPMAALGVIDTGTTMTMIFVGLGVFLGGSVAGYFRGVALYRQQNAVAAGFGGNPMDKINFYPVVSQDGKNFGFNLMYSTKF